MSGAAGPQDLVDMFSRSATAGASAPGKLERSSSAAVLADHLSRKPNLLVTLLLLILIGLRPTRLSDQLRANDEAAWLDFRGSLIQRWQTVMITTGLVMGAAASAVFSDKVAGGSYLMALASLCCALIAITFGTGLSFIFQDASPNSIVKVARRPVAMLAVLASPTFFAVGAMLCFYASITALAYQNLDKAAVDILARIGTTGGAVLMVGIFLASAWLVWDMDHQDDESAAEKGLPRPAIASPWPIGKVEGGLY
ncbi:hypothetical protein DFH07DRAFT_1054524 [Mycena maculata]|uniref:Uncharacterized protein n=1 Tax=Mycena maculata TaxID=230809 RepID=A0AAD7P2C8_9AGAR|nr:hypothetical protein DFH07DRAFT_1054524 [Mycena maculata]